MARRSRKDRKYSPELKIAAVQAYLSGEGRQQEICKRFHIPAKRTLEVWIMCYTGHKEFKRPSVVREALYIVKEKKIS